MKVGLAGQGAFGIKHLEAIANIPGIEVITLTGGNPDATKEVAQKFRIPHWSGDLAESLKQPGLDAMLLATPTQMHATQAIQCMRAGKHVMIEIPMADNLADAEKIVQVQKETGLVRAGHTRRFNPIPMIHETSRQLKLLQMDVQTYFFRRTNMMPASAAGPTILWHHASTRSIFRTPDRRAASVGVASRSHAPDLKMPWT